MNASAEFGSAAVGPYTGTHTSATSVVVVQVSALPADPVEMPDIVIEPRESPASAIEAGIYGQSLLAITMTRLPAVVHADRPLDIEFAAVGLHPGTRAAVSVARYLSIHAHLSVDIEMRSQSRASFSASTTVHPGNGGWIARALIPPSTWANAVSVTVVALSLAGQPLPCKYLPLFLHVGYNHTPAPEGAVLVAGKAGNVPALQAALEARGSTEEANDSGCTALYYTASRGHLEAFQILLAAGANPVAATKNGITPLHIAAYHGQTRIIALLLDTPRVDPLAPWHDKTPLDLAREHGHDAAAALLAADLRVAGALTAEIPTPAL